MIRIVDMKWVGASRWDHPSALHFDMLVHVDGERGPDVVRTAFWTSKNYPWVAVHVNGGCQVEHLASDIRDAIEGSSVQRHGNDPEGFPYAFYSAMARCFFRFFGRPGSKFLRGECDSSPGADEVRFEEFKQAWWRESLILGIRMSGVLERPGGEDLALEIFHEMIVSSVVKG